MLVLSSSLIVLGESPSLVPESPSYTSLSPHPTLISAPSREKVAGLDMRNAALITRYTKRYTADFDLSYYEAN